MTNIAREIEELRGLPTPGLFHSVVDWCFLPSIAAKISADSYRPAIRGAIRLIDMIHVRTPITDCQRLWRVMRQSLNDRATKLQVGD